VAVAPAKMGIATRASPRWLSSIHGGAANLCRESRGGALLTALADSSSP